MFIHHLIITDIGPFAGQTRHTIYRLGNTLVKASIGSGKSFLYFDAPLYALYKYAPRNLVNINAKSGLITAVIEAQDDIYLIHRSLKKGGIKDSCSSILYKRTTQDFTAVSSQRDTKTSAKSIMAHPSWEQLYFKNESDLQQSLEQLLPPREVFTSTHMLTQDADHIFQMQPAQRVEVFKHLFDLMGIDDAKEIIVDHHRGLKHTITILSDTSRVDHQLQHELRQLSVFCKRLSSATQDSLILLNQEIDRCELISKAVSLQQYTRDLHIDEQMETRISQLQDQHAIYLTTQTTIKHYQQQLQDLIEKKEKLTKTLVAQTQRLGEIQQGQGLDLVPQLTQCKEEYQTQSEQIQRNTSSLPLVVIQSWLHQYVGTLGIIVNVDDWTQIDSFLMALIQHGKHLTQQIEVLEQSKLHAQEQAIQLIASKRESHQQRIKQLKQEEVSLQERRQQLQLQIDRFEKDSALALHFECVKIKDSCPFVAQINTSSVKAIHQQRELLQQQHSDLDQLIRQKNIPAVIAQEEQKFATLQQPLGGGGASLDESIVRYKSQQQIIKQCLIDINRKQLQLDIQHVSTQNQTLQQLALSIQSLQSKVDQQLGLIQEMNTLQHLNQEYKQQILQIETNIAQLTQQYKELQQHSDQSAGEHITNDLSCLQTIQQHISAIRRLISSYQEDKLRLLQIKEQESFVSELVKIFAKDLMREVVRTSLPLIQESINSYLSQVVDYELTLDLKETSGGNLELDALISDQRGIREVKSLSGGQKVVLKIAWIMAVSSFLKVKFLFLDETINNLDQETTGLVSKMFEAFVKKQNIAFICITHSPEIQQINIRDEVVQL